MENRRKLPSSKSFSNELHVIVTEETMDKTAAIPAEKEIVEEEPGANKGALLEISTSKEDASYSEKSLVARFHEMTLSPVGSPGIDELLRQKEIRQVIKIFKSRKEE